MAAVVCAAFVAGAGVLLLLGVTAPFYRFMGEPSFALSDQNGPLLAAVLLAALVCVGALVGELLRFREALLAGLGVVAAVGIFVARYVVSAIAGLDGAEPWIGAFAWLVVVLASALTTTMLAGIVSGSERSPSPVVFAGCALGGGIVMALALLLPPPGFTFGEHLGASAPAVAVFVLLYAFLPALGGALVMAFRHRAVHIVMFGVVAWYTLDWAQAGMQARGLLADLGGRFYLLALGLLIVGLATIGGGFVRWTGGSATSRSARDYALPIATVSVFVIVVLAGLIG